MHRALLADSLALLRHAAARARALPMLSVSERWNPGEDEADADLATAADDLALVVQRGADLGERLLGTFRHLQEGSERRSVVIFGADSPTLPADRLSEAFPALRSRNDLILGPCEDGGYYLIGAKRVTAGLFAGIPWGTSQVLPATLRAAKRARRRITLLPPWYDIDGPEDLARLRRDLEVPSASRAGTTAAFLDRLARAGRFDPAAGPEGRGLHASSLPARLNRLR